MEALSSKSLRKKASVVEKSSGPGRLRDERQTTLILRFPGYLALDVTLSMLATTVVL